MAIFACGILPYYLNIFRAQFANLDFEYQRDTGLWTSSESSTALSNAEYKLLQESESYITEVYGEEGYFFDVLLSMMHVGVAGMELGLYDGIYDKFLYIFFMLAVLLLNVTMLNMLIAIMGDIYDETSQRRKEIRRKAQLFKLSEYIGVITPDENDADFGFLHSPIERVRLVLGYDTREMHLDKNQGQNLYVCEMDSFMVGTEEEWEGKITFLKKHMDKLVNGRYDQMVSKIEKINDKSN